MFPQLIHSLIRTNKYVTAIEEVQLSKLVYSVNIPQTLFLLTRPNIAQGWYDDGILNSLSPVRVQTQLQY